MPRTIIWMKNTISEAIIIIFKWGEVVGITHYGVLRMKQKRRVRHR